MRSKFLHILAAAFALSCSISFAAAQSDFLDLEKKEVLQAVLAAEMQRLRLGFPREIVISSEGIESLAPETNTSDFRMTVIKPERIDERLRTTAREVLIVRDIQANPSGYMVTISRLRQHHPEPCFGPSRRCQQSVVYEVQPFAGEWMARAKPLTRLNLGLFEDCDEISLRMIY